MAEVKINKDIDVRKAIEERVVDHIKDLIVFTNIDDMIKNVNNWYDSCGSRLEYMKSNGNIGYVETSDIYGIYSRKFVYESLITYLENKKKSDKYFVAIPAGDNAYVTLVRFCSGNLVLGDRRYFILEVLKRHNSNVPGGITLEEVESSDLGWCLPFMEKIDE